MKSKNQPTYHLKGKNWQATAYATANGFLVMGGSTSSKTLSPSTRPGYLRRWKKLKQDGVLTEQEKCLVFNRDFEFSSSSTAASIIAGNNKTGPMVWKDSKGVTLRERRLRETKA